MAKKVCYSLIANTTLCVQGRSQWGARWGHGHPYAECFCEKNHVHFVYWSPDLLKIGYMTPLYVVKCPFGPLQVLILALSLCVLVHLFGLY
jgi:hypothetical protein